MLYCDTLARGFVSGCGVGGRPLLQSFKHLTFYHPIIQTFQSLPKVDFFGLQSWNDKTERSKFHFDDYDVVWLYLNSVPMKPSWFTFPKEIRKVSNTKIVFTLDYEGVYVKEYPRHSWDTESYFWNDASAMHCITRDGVRVFKGVLKIPVFYGHPFWVPMPNVYPSPLPKEEREGIISIHHTSGGNHKFDAAIVKNTKLPITIIGGGRKPWIEETFGRHSSLTLLPRIPWKEYIKVVNKAKIGLDCEYYGPSRFSYECAMLKIPVVGSPHTENARILFPHLNYPRGSTALMSSIIRQLFIDKKLYDVTVEEAYKMATTDFSLKACVRRLSKKLKQLAKDS